MPPPQRIVIALAALFCLTFVFTLRDSGPAFVRQVRIELPPVPESITERPGRVTLAVENEDGAPLADASIRVLSVQDDRAYLAGAARTDVAGKAEIAALPKGEAWILAEGEGFARASTRLVIDEAARDVKMRLRAAAALHVQVQDDGGAAVSGAWVEVRTGDPLPFVTQADAKGQAHLSRLGPPPWNVRAKAPGYDFFNDQVARVGKDPLKITLRKLGFIDVMTVDADGKTIAGATVLVAGSGLWPARKVESDAGGRAKVPDLPRGIYDFRATRGDLVSPAEMGVALGRGESKTVTLVLAPGRRVAVRATDGDEEGAAPVAAANVVLAEGGLSSFPLEASTDARGLATLGPLAPGDAFLSVIADGFVPRTGVAVPVGSAPTVRIGLVRGGTIRGEVVDARGFPVDGASIEVVGTTPSGEPIDESPDRTAFRAAHFSWALAGPSPLIAVGELGVMPGALPSIPHAGALSVGLRRGPDAKPPPEPWVTRDDGTFRASPVPPGRVRAIVRHPAYIEGISEPTTLAVGGEAHLRIVLHGGGSLEGRVLDDRRAPLGGVRVEIASTRGTVERSTQTADDGTFAFAAVPGEIVLSLSRPDASDDVALRTNVSIREAERKEIELVLPAAREAMNVEVVDERAAPVDGAQVLVLSLQADAPLRRTSFTGKDGHVAFKDAVGLPVRVSVTRRGHAPEVREVDPAPAELRIELKSGARVAGLVTSRRGRDALEGADVTLYTASGTSRARSDRAGSYGFEDVAPGPARVVVSRVGYAKVERAIEIAPSTHGDRPAQLEPIDLDEGGSVEGEVVDARGEPVSGARVATGSVPAYLPAGKMPAGVVLTNQRGQFKIDDLREGDVAIEAYAPDVGRGRAVEVHVSAGSSTRGVRIALSSADGEPTADTPSTGGVAVALDENASSGALVSSVVEGSEAERAGLKAGDRIVAVDDAPVASPKEARVRLFGPIGNDLVLDIVRGDEKQRVRVARERVQR